MVYFNAKDATLELIEKNALPLKYKRKDWHPRRQAKISDFVGKAALKRFINSDMIQVKNKVCPNR